jgi:hypothetical protein
MSLVTLQENSCTRWSLVSCKIFALHCRLPLTKIRKICEVQKTAVVETVFSDVNVPSLIDLLVIIYIYIYIYISYNNKGHAWLWIEATHFANFINGKWMILQTSHIFLTKIEIIFLSILDNHYLFKGYLIIL